MRHIIPFLLLYLSTFSITCAAQSPVTDPTGTIYHKVDVPPEFVGGDDARDRFLTQNIHYPRSAQEKGASGTVIVQFVIDENGNVLNPTSQSPYLDTSLQRESIRVVQLMPKWKPGLLDGKEVKVRFYLPIKYTLQIAGESRSSAFPVIPKVAPTAKDSVLNVIYYTDPANKPAYPGGENGLTKYLKKNLNYPQEALESGIEGIVTVQFTINGDGTISNVSTISPKLGGRLEMEAIRLIRSMPNWKPAMENGKPVPAQCNIPIEFSLKEYYTKKRKVYPMF
ncbi:energy transducer TonB [Chitinophaga sancti]|uniref:Energy transducer TonB n=1 Tax=Chitinophaga sancti TaxID=1004 RepID=A0A1K1QK28_9BACT|nr:energy transducer TonB [Chitinophaga sancti]WQD65172.1 energy transducer TonB [Chitinophaga sancti]WQG89204.1 energy transducer TonB [Chitinophaga sancti]SFW60303.1 TonB family C-terminal domain-containing protein [Chitinophaga sancti]